MPAGSLFIMRMRRSMGLQNHDESTLAGRCARVYTLPYVWGEGGWIKDDHEQTGLCYVTW